MLTLSASARSGYNKQFYVRTEESKFKSTYYDGDYIRDPGIRLPGYSESENTSAGSIEIYYGGNKLVTAYIEDDRNLDYDYEGNASYDYHEESKFANYITETMNKVFEEIYKNGSIQDKQVKKNIPYYQVDEIFQTSNDWKKFFENMMNNYVSDIELVVEVENIKYLPDYIDTKELVKDSLF